MRRERAGAALSPSTAAKLVEHAAGSTKAVLDGFPSSLEHIALLPAETVFCVVWTPRRLRLERLEHRAATSKRLWTPGLHSERESALPSLIASLRQSRHCIFIANDTTRETAVEEILRKLGDF
jgi:hypothetical protein